MASAPSLAKGGRYGLPRDARIIETKTLPPSIHPDRLLVLWMLTPQEVPWSRDFYACPDYTRGSHYRGPTRVSLVDSHTGSVINTVEVIAHGEDSFDIPYRLRQGPYYEVR